MGENAYTRFQQVYPAEALPHAEGFAEKRLLLMRCNHCGHVRLPHSFVCPVCHDVSYDWIEACGKGTIYSYVTFRRAFHPAVADALPYVVAQVRLQEGPLYLTNIVNCDVNVIYCNQIVGMLWEKNDSTGYLPVFTPVD